MSRWYVVSEKNKDGPFSLEELRAKLIAGELELDALLMREGSVIQCKVLDVPELFSQKSDSRVFADNSKTKGAFVAEPVNSMDNDATRVATQTRLVGESLFHEKISPGTVVVDKSLVFDKSKLKDPSIQFGVEKSLSKIEDAKVEKNKSDVKVKPSLPAGETVPIEIRKTGIVRAHGEEEKRRQVSDSLKRDGVLGADIVGSQENLKKKKVQLKNEDNVESSGPSRKMKHPSRLLFSRKMSSRLREVIFLAGITAGSVLVISLLSVVFWKAFHAQQHKGTEKEAGISAQAVPYVPQNSHLGVVPKSPSDAEFNPLGGTGSALSPSTQVPHRVFAPKTVAPKAIVPKPAPPKVAPRKKSAAETNPGEAKSAKEKLRKNEQKLKKKSKNNQISLQDSAVPASVPVKSVPKPTRIGELVRYDLVKTVVIPAQCAPCRIKAKLSDGSSVLLVSPSIRLWKAAEIKGTAQVAVSGTVIKITPQETWIMLQKVSKKETPQK